MSKFKMLIVVDVQNDFVTGSLGSAAAQEVVPSIVERVAVARENKEFVVFTQDTHNAENYMSSLERKKLPVPHCYYQTDGWKIVPELAQEAALCIYKGTFGSFDLVSRVSGILKGFDISEDDLEIELCGFVTSICVLANAVILRAGYPNCKITVNRNLCADVTTEAHEAALLCLAAQQIDVI